MGISIHVYTIVGAKIEWNDEFNEAYDEVYNDDDTPFVLIDGMSGEYIIFGTVLFDSGDFRWGCEGGDDLKEIELSSLKGIEKKYKAEFVNKFPKFKSLIDTPFKLMTLVHYS